MGLIGACVVGSTLAWRGAAAGGPQCRGDYRQAHQLPHHSGDPSFVPAANQGEYSLRCEGLASTRRSPAFGQEKTGQSLHSVAKAAGKHAGRRSDERFDDPLLAEQGRPSDHHWQRIGGGGVRLGSGDSHKRATPWATGVLLRASLGGGDRSRGWRVTQKPKKSRGQERVAIRAASTRAGCDRCAERYCAG